MISVYNVAEGEEVAQYSCSERESVIAAYAQSKKDYNTWEYEVKYGHRAKKTRYGWVANCQ